MDSNPTFVVLGATGGIGSDLCRRLLSTGANVVGAGRNPEKVRALADSCGLRPYTLDANDMGQVIACVSEARETFGRVDGVANCVGSLLIKPAHLTSESDWQATLTTNLTTAFATVHAGVKSMMETGGGDCAGLLRRGPDRPGQSRGHCGRESGYHRPDAGGGRVVC